MPVTIARTLAGGHQVAPERAVEPVEIVSRTAAMMGGRVGVHLSPASDSGTFGAAAEADAVLRRIGAWAARLTRFTTTSDLSRLNDDPRARVPVSPTLAAVLDWGRYAEEFTDGIVDIGLLDARLSAEREPGAGRVRLAAHHAASPASRAWSLDRRARGTIMRRPVGLRFDLDGIGKGWLADRSLGLLGRHPAAVVDADGDIAIRLEAGTAWCFGVADPRLDDHDLAMVRLTPRGGQDGRMNWLNGHFGLATSGTSVHRWAHNGRVTHHLIDPRTGRPAETDIVQATVLARTAREAEVLAKAAVILGSVAGYALLERSGVDGAILLTDRNEVVVHPAALQWLA